MADPRDVVRRWYELADAHDTAGTAELVTHDCEMEAPGVSLKGPEQIASWMQVFFDAFPDLNHPVNRVAVAGDVVAVELHTVGSHTGTLASPQGDVPPTGRPLDLRVANLITVDGDRVTSVHIYFDQMEFLGQLGLLPA